jgi:DNA topoisomerase-2
MTITPKIFHKDDRYLLNYLNEEGISIEPVYYIPVLPMALVNGAEGIGTGWSTYIPCYNPIDIIKALKDKMEGKEFERLTPWYKHYGGEIFHNEKQFVCEGRYEHDADSKVLRITELPIRKWTREYKKMLEEMLQSDILSDMREYHGSNTVDFELYYENATKEFASDEAIMKYFKLSTTLADSNYVLFDKNNKLRRYADETEIMEEFYEIRIDLYSKRKDYLVRKLVRDLEVLDNKVRFITEVIEEKIKVNNRKKKELLSVLRERGYTKYSDIMAKVPEANAMRGEVVTSDNEEDKVQDLEDLEDERIEGLASDYNYLLNQQIWSLTKEKIEALKAEKLKKEQEIEELKKVTIYDLWNRDLDSILDDINKIERKEKDVMMKAKAKIDKIKAKKDPNKKKKK